MDIPIPNMKGRWITLLAKEAAASGIVPSRPIMRVSATYMSIWLTCPMIRGSAKEIVARPSRSHLSKDRMESMGVIRTRPASKGAPKSKSPQENPASFGELKETSKIQIRSQEGRPSRPPLVIGL
jgi:hypothetical protein